MSIKSIPAAVKAAVVKVWQKEPARVVSVVAAVIVFAAAKSGVIVSTQSVIDALGLALPVLLGGEVIRANVTPSK